MKISLSIRDLSALENALKTKPELIQKTLVTAVQVGALVVANDAKKRAPVRTGNLRRSIFIGKVMVDNRTASVAVGPSAIYGKWVEFGTGPRVILPRRKKALFWKGAAHPVKKVNHPGTKARPFLRPALTENVALITDRMRMVFRSMLQ